MGSLGSPFLLRRSKKKLLNKSGELQGGLNMLIEKKTWSKGVLASGVMLMTLAQTQDVEILAETTCSTEEECQVLINETQKEIEQLEEETKKKTEDLTVVEESIEMLMDRIDETELKIKKTTSEIKVKESEIKTSETTLKALELDISDLKEVVGVRMRVSQRLTRSNIILNWLSEATSLAELIRSIQTVNHFASNDAIQMEKLKGLVMEQNQLMETLKVQKTSLTKAKEELEESRQQLAMDQKALEAKRNAVKKEIQVLESEKLSAEEAKEIAEEQKALLERLAAEEERRRQEEEERKKQEAMQQQQQASVSTSENSEDENLNASTGSNDSTSSDPSTVIPSSATFRIPLATGYVSCEFMCYPGHNGIDLGNGGNTSTPVLATASGIVTRSGWHHAYGNHVMITHNIDGKIYTTVYAHMHTTPYVKVGDVVYQGQQVGTMGNTGNSTGAHLHFELYEGYYNYPYSVNPRKYINFPSRW